MTEKSRYADATWFMKLTAYLDQEVEYTVYTRETLEGLLGFLGGINALAIAFV